ncbi:MAG: metal-sulfur cluster assembly factor [FCB group bacterium]|nr:metal-sulfur cluster assembly factor [FCB group bacterium]
MSVITREKIIDILKQCYDPEIPVDLWNLGLIYDIGIRDSHEDGKADVNIVMTLTTPGCGMGQYMARGIKAKLESLEEVQQAFVQITFDPPWRPAMMTAEAKRKLGFEPQPDPENSGAEPGTEWE